MDLATEDLVLFHYILLYSCCLWLFCFLFFVFSHASLCLKKWKFLWSLQCSLGQNLHWKYSENTVALTQTMKKLLHYHPVIQLIWQIQLAGDIYRQVLREALSATIYLGNWDTTKTCWCFLRSGIASSS